MHPMLIIAVRAARLAGRIITRAAEDLDRVKIARKSPNDFVTEVDQAAEKVIIETLSNAYPAHSILAEESGLKGKDEAEKLEAAENLWIIDPLDGTTNFIHGLPQYCVSIGLMQRGQMTQAVVYDPNRDELFTASKGRGAFLNDRRIRVSRRDRLAETVIGTGFPFKNIAKLDEYLKHFKQLTIEGATIRRPGAAALDLAYVACGRYDAFFEMGLSPWDVAAGSLLVTESGGLIGDYNGDPAHVFGERVIAGTPKVFTAMLGVFQPSTASK